MEKWVSRYSGTNLKRTGDSRDPFERDYSRIVHSAAFRRLQGKTQVLGLGDSDFYRTRLTHSLEAAQIATGIVKTLERNTETTPPDYIAYLPSVALITAITLAHDIGHPAFGHGGESALHYLMYDSGGFEGNAQSLRILANLEPYTESHGADLTRRTLLGVIKYPVTYSEIARKVQPNHVPYQHDGWRPQRFVSNDWRPPKCIYDSNKKILDWVLDPLSTNDRELFISHTASEDPKNHSKSKFRSFDTSIMDLADKIAYAIHDLEDAIHLGLITRELWLASAGDQLACLSTSLSDDLGLSSIEELTNSLFSGIPHQRKFAIGSLINYLIKSIFVSDINSFSSPLLRYHANLGGTQKSVLNIIRDFVTDHVIRNPAVQTLEYRGQQLLLSLFDAFKSDPDRLLPKATKHKYNSAKDEDESKRVISDHLSGMTNEFATKCYERLFIPRTGSLFQRI